MTDVLHLPAFRMALACIAQDPQIPATLRERMREHLHALGLTRTLESPEHDALLREIIVWADAQGTSASAMICKAIGQARAETADHTGRPQAHRATTQAAFDHAYTQGVSMNTTTAPPQNSPIQEVSGDADWSELDRQAALLLHPPWEYGKDRVTKAVNAIKTGHVTLGTPATSLATVTSEDGQRHYTVREDGCTCRATHPCYHMAAAELGRLMEGKQAQPSLFPQPQTIDERLAAPARAPEETRSMATAVLHTTPFPEALPEDAFIVPTASPRPTPSLALPRRSISAIIADLSRPLPSACVAVKPADRQGSRPIEFLHWQTVARILDTYAPGWSGEVKLDRIPDPKGVTGDKVVVIYRLMIPTADGLIAREATGQEDVEMVEEYTDSKSGEVKTKRAYGDSTSNAEAMAFKRAAAKFGVGSSLYDKDDTAHALDTHLRAERARMLGALGTLVDTLGFERKTVITWLQKQTGVQSNAQIPLWALQALMSHLSSQTGTA